MHPSLSEHSVRYIALYKDTAEIARIYLHPVFSAPKVTFTIALDEGGTLRALAEPTHSAGVGGLEEDQRRALRAHFPARASTVSGRDSRVTAVAPSAVTSWRVCPRRSCQTRTVYCPGGTLSSLKRPWASVMRVERVARHHHPAAHPRVQVAVDADDLRARRT